MLAGMNLFFLLKGKKYHMRQEDKDSGVVSDVIDIKEGIHFNSSKDVMHGLKI